MSQAFPKPPRYGVHLTPSPQPLSQDQFQQVIAQARHLHLGWVVIPAPASRAIPEAMIRPWVEQGVRVIIHLQAPLFDPPSPEEMAPLLEAYARWGVRHILWFDRPNLRAAWGDTWTLSDPALRTADALLPLIHKAQEMGLTSLLPPLAQGGDYWDTAFLRRLLSEIRRRAAILLPYLGLAVEARTFGRPLTWGQGGPEAWPEAQPYATPKDSQDQRGFCAFDWYAAISRAVTGQTMPMFLVRMGPTYAQGDPVEVTRQLVDIAALMGFPHPAPEVNLHEAVFGGAFWVLTAPPGSPHEREAWLPPNGAPRPVVERLAFPRPQRSSVAKAGPSPTPPPYVLLPQDPELTPWALDLVRPLLLHLQATVGFSLEEARHAHTVIVVGSPEVVPESTLHELRQRGCRVRRVQTGTEVASLIPEISDPPSEVQP